MDTNEPSLRLFKSLGFVVYKHMAIFEQTELRLPADAARQQAAAAWEEMQASEETCKPPVTPESGCCE